MTRIAICPQCGGKASLAADNTHRPFCSARCKTLDLGGWLSEKYSLPAVESEDDTPPQDGSLQ
ncbi:MAG: DNA gyrase inhibitor YacG [Panacagrimonas sp.]